VSDYLNRVYDILVETCGASEYWRDNFLQTMADGDCREYRFQGDLGFGGKLYRTDRVYVGYYPEDKTPERDAMVAAANERIAALNGKDSA